jgi:hypothetical protein
VLCTTTITEWERKSTQFQGVLQEEEKSEEVFESTDTTMNNHLKQFMEGLSAKVFRYCASRQDE